MVDSCSKQKTVRTEINKPLPPDQPGHDLGHLIMNQGFPPRNGDNRRTAFIGGSEALLQTESSTEDLFRVADLSAAGT